MRGHVQAGLIAAALLCVAMPAAAMGATVQTVEVGDSSSDAPLSTAGKDAKECQSADESKGCTLRAAVELANLLSSEADTPVKIAVPAGTFTNTAANGGTLAITSGAQVEIVGEGPSKTTINGGGVASVLTVADSGKLILSGVSVSGGHATEGGGVLGFAGADVVIEDCDITSNSATRGGGVVLRTARERPTDVSADTVMPAAKLQTGELKIYQSTIAANEASEDGGGIYLYEGYYERTGVTPDAETPAKSVLQGGLMIEQSTISDNRAGADGGGIYESEEILDPIVNSTITGNSAGEYGGGLYVTLTELTLIADTFSDNTATQGDGWNITGENDAEIDLARTLIAEPAGSSGPGCEGVDESLGYNLDFPSKESEVSPGVFADGCELSTKTNDLVGVNPELDPKGLQNNGGPTQTIALLGPVSGTPSPAIGAVPIASCLGPTAEPLTVDQRGSTRPGIAGDGCDIGAYEFSPTVVTPTCEASPATVREGQTSRIECTLTKSDGDFATGVTSTITLPSGATLDGNPTPSQGNCSGLSCELGTIDPATVTFTIAPKSSTSVGFTAGDAETGSHSTSVAVTVTSATVPTSVSVVKSLPPSTQCASLRDFKIHIQHAKQLKITSATVYVDDRSKQTLTSKHLTGIVDLRGLPTGTFTVEITAHTASGHTLTGKRTYHTCRPTPLPGHKYFKL